MKRVVPGVTILLFLLSAAACQAVAQAGASVGGVVRDLHGTPQMGALVELLGPDAAVLARTFTDDHGRYALTSLDPGRYQLRASAAFLLPVLRSNLRLFVGTRALANLTMTAVFEVGVWFPAERRATEEPADDWRWTLRSSASRPLLRLAGDASSGTESSSADHRTAYEPQERVAVLSGDGQFAGGGTHQVFSVDRAEGEGRTEVLRADLGEQGIAGAAPFLAMNAGYERKLPMGAETRMVMGAASHPEIYGPGAVGLQAMTVASSERMAFGDAVMIDAGTLLSAERLVASRITSAPFVRLVVSPADGVALMYRFAADRSLQSSDDLNQVEVSPSVLSDAAGRPISTAGAHQEIGISRVDGKDTMTVALYRDDLPVAALQGGGHLTSRGISGLPVVADENTGAFRIAVDGYLAHGVSVSWTHVVSPALSASMEADLGTALQRNAADLTLAGVHDGIHTRTTPAISGIVHGNVTRSGTAFRAQYRWQPRRSLDAVNAYNTASDRAYLSLFLRQRLWSGRRLQGLDAVLEATNLLEEGYQPMIGPDGQTLFLAQVPRAMQAGLSFSF